MKTTLEIYMHFIDPRKGLFRKNQDGPKVGPDRFVFVARPLKIGQKSVPKCLLFFQDLQGLTEVFGRTVRRDVRPKNYFGPIFGLC